MGLGLALHSWVTLLATPVISAAILGQRVHAEEQLMTEALGDPYVRYMARTKRYRDPPGRSRHAEAEVAS